MSVGQLWTPERIGTILAHYSADRIAGNDGDAIATWANLAPTGSSYDFTQATAGKKPALKRNRINGRSSVLFDGTSDFMTGTFTISNAMTRFLVFKLTAVPTAGQFFSFGDIKDSANSFAYCAINNFAGYQNYDFKNKTSAAATASVGFNDAPDTSAHILAITYDNGTSTLAASYSASLDGTAKVLTATGVLSLPTTNKCAVGADVSTTDVGSSFFNGEIAEQIIFSGVLGANDLANVVKYLKNLYGIA
jgi:hypothetical protein